MVLATPVVQVLIVIHVEALSVVVVHIGNTGIQEIPYIVVIVAPIWDTAIMDTTMAHTATIVLMTMAIHLALVVMDIDKVFIAGRHNLENCMAAIMIAKELGVEYTYDYIEGGVECLDS